MLTNVQNISWISNGAAQGEVRFYPKDTLRADEVTQQTGNLVKQTFKNFRGPGASQAKNYLGSPYAPIRHRFLHEKKTWHT